jgi:hypothetical protein
MVEWIYNLDINLWIKQETSLSDKASQDYTIRQETSSEQDLEILGTIG